MAFPCPHFSAINLQNSTWNLNQINLADGSLWLQQRIQLQELKRRSSDYMKIWIRNFPFSVLSLFCGQKEFSLNRLRFIFSCPSFFLESITESHKQFSFDGIFLCQLFLLWPSLVIQINFRLYTSADNGIIECKMFATFSIFILLLIVANSFYYSWWPFLAATSANFTLYLLVDKVLRLVLCKSNRVLLSLDFLCFMKSY